jgi:SAM-dependent methyltransferase
LVNEGGLVEAWNLYGYMPYLERRISKFILPRIIILIPVLHIFVQMSEKKLPLVESQRMDDGGSWIERLESLLEPPPLFSSGAPFWDDPYISKNLLNSYLDAEQGVASRPLEVALSSVEWMISRCDLDRGSCVLDLGCGPGPYCQHFAEMGMNVRGIDLSAASLRYAEMIAQSRGLDIVYLEGDYLQMEIDMKFDLIIMVYGDLCTLAPDDRDHLLRKVHSWLRPGGFFIFDVVSYSRLKHLDQVCNWHASHDSFWRSDPYLLLEHSFDYPDEGVRLEQYIVIEKNGKITTYRFWYKHYSEMELEEVLRKAGLEMENIYGDLTGSSYCEDCDWMGVVARPL